MKKTNKCPSLRGLSCNEYNGDRLLRDWYDINYNSKILAEQEKTTTMVKGKEKDTNFRQTISLMHHIVIKKIWLRWRKRIWYQTVSRWFIFKLINVTKTVNHSVSKRRKRAWYRTASRRVIHFDRIFYECYSPDERHWSTMNEAKKTSMDDISFNWVNCYININYPKTRSGTTKVKGILHIKSSCF